MPLKMFLARARSNLQAGLKSPGQRLTFVMGNESADLDSMTSALLYAYIRSSTKIPLLNTPLYIPIVDMPRADIRLRPEFLWLLSRVGLEPNDLIMVDELWNEAHFMHRLSDHERERELERTRWVLVDHNALRGWLGVFRYRVYGVIDHHIDEGSLVGKSTDDPRIIQKCGSCTSLVVNYLRKQWDELDEPPTHGAEGGILEWDAQVAKLALASIVVDTNNLRDESKTTEDDKLAADFLECKLREASTFDRTAFFDNLSEAKQNIGNLGLHDILRKDFKVFTEPTGGNRLGIAVVVKPLQFLVAKAVAESLIEAYDRWDDEFLESVEDFGDGRDLDFLAIMTAFTATDGCFRRELLVWALSHDLVPAIEKFEETSGAELGLVEWDGDFEVRNRNVKVWSQKATQHSRKKVAPLLRELLKQ
jgi:exopolyphosphatase